MTIECKNYAEIDLHRLVQNFRLLCENVYKHDRNAKPICVVKADAYGHGARECVRALASVGADFFAVSDASEALEVKAESAECKILILGYSNPKNALVLAENNIIQEVHCYEYALALNEQLQGTDKKLSVHIKLDTGMSRIGFPTGEGLLQSIDEIEEISKLSNISVEGVFSHLACADENCPDMTDEQICRFDEAVGALRARGLKLCSHICNTAASIKRGSAGHDFFRLGISLYGHLPDYEMSFPGLLPVMSFFGSVAQVHTLHAGDAVSYGATFVADRDIKVATVTVGYADGLFRSASGAHLLLNGQKAKILGRVCMDQCIVCADGIDVKMGDAVTVYDRDGENTKELCRHLGTISYELVCAVSKRVVRKYI